MFVGIVERMKRGLSRAQEAWSRRGLKVWIGVGCALMVLSLFFILVEGQPTLVWFGNVFVGTMLITEGAAILSFENRPTLAVLMRLASILFMVLFVAVVVADVYG